MVLFSFKTSCEGTILFKDKSTSYNCAFKQVHHLSFFENTITAYISLKKY